MDMVKNYYHILGVEPGATLEEIKSAYRRKAKELHPDYYGQDSGPFRDVQEAYDVLNDPQRRQTYDAERVRCRSVRPPRSEPLWSAPVEPLRPLDEPVGGETFPFGWPASLFDDWLEPSWSDFTPPTGFHRPQELTLEVTLTPAQAQHGGRLEVTIPVRQHCPDCSGRGFLLCRRCAGQGVVVAAYSIRLTFPGGIADRDTGEVRLDRFGLPGVYLILYFRVANF